MIQSFQGYGHGRFLYQDFLIIESIPEILKPRNNMTGYDLSGEQLMCASFSVASSSRGMPGFNMLRVSQSCQKRLTGKVGCLLQACVG